MTFRAICFSGVLVLLGGAGAAGCGGDDSARSSSGPFSTGLPGNESFDTLTEADVAKLCSSLKKRLTNDRALNDATCHIFGFVDAWAASLDALATDADLQKACTDSETECKSTARSFQQGTCSKPAGACTASIEEFEACVTDSIGEVIQESATLPACSSITRADLHVMSSGGNGAMPSSGPASCQTLEQKCPGVQASTGLKSGNDSTST